MSNRLYRLPENLIALRKKNKVTKGMIQNATGLARPSLRDWELYRRVPNLYSAMTLAEYFHVTLDELVYEDLTNDDIR